MSNLSWRQVLDPVVMARRAALRNAVLAVSEGSVGSDQMDLHAIANGLRVDGDAIRSTPVDDHAGCEFRYSFLWRRSLDPEVIPREILVQLRSFIERREAIVVVVEKARSLAKRFFIEAAELRNSALCSIGVEMSEADDFVTTLEFVGLNDDLARGIVSVDGYDLDEIERYLISAARRQGRRRELLNAARDIAARGWIDRTALHLIERCGFTLDLVMAELEQRSEFLVEVGGGEDPVVATFQWNEGVLEVSFQIEDRLGYDNGTLFVDCTGLPTTTLSALPGRRVGDLVAHPFLPADLLITGVTAEVNGFQWLALRRALIPLPSAPYLAS